MKLCIEYWVCFILVVFFIEGQAQEATTESTLSNKTSTTYLYRIINWCLVGRGEYELFEWPFLQFRPLLLEDYKVRSYEDNFSEEDNQKHAESQKEYYQKPNMELKFESIQCKESQDSVGVKATGAYLQRVHVKFTSDVLIEGLIIQGVHAPFGLGFPFGQFDQSSEFECDDCEFFKGVVIGCISRPGGELMHPTAGVFHHKHLKGNSSFKYEVGLQKEIHWNYKWVDQKCSSARIVEFWVMVVMSFDEKIWMTHKFGPYDFETEDSKRVKVKEDSADIVQPGIPSIIMPKCQRRLHPPPFPLLDECVNDPTDSNADLCKKEKEQIKNVSIPIPGTIKCHSGIPYEFLASGDGFDKTDIWSRIRVVGSFDVDCLTKYPVRQAPYKVCPQWQGQYLCSGSAEDLVFNEPQMKAEELTNSTRLFPQSYCEPCVTLKPTPKSQDVDDRKGLIKRTPHTMLMIAAFFFILPLSAFISRFYKETLHTMEIKGYRLWLLIHSLSGIFILLLCYASYTLATFWKLDAHMYTGYGAVFCCAGGFFSGWGRHKSFYLKWTLIMSHLSCGYSAYGLALTSYIIHGKVGEKSKMAAMGSCALSIVAIFAMSFHVFSVDRKLGVVPTRTQIPIINIRFDDVFPPGHRFRIIFMALYAVLLLAVCCAMITFE